MSDAAGMMDNITMRELRGMVGRIDALCRQLEKTQNQQASQIAHLTSQLMSVGQTALTMQFWGNRLSSALNKGHPLGVAMPILGSVSLGIGRGLQAAAETQKLGEYIRSGEIQFGTEADKQRYAVEQALRMTFSFLGI